MKKILLLFLLPFFLTNAFSQGRGGHPKFDGTANPYDKLLKDTSAGKRTAKFLMNFTQPEVLRDYFTSSPCAEYTQLSDTRISQFNEFVEQFLNGRTDAKQMTKAENDFKKKGLTAQIAEIEKHMDFIEKQGSFTTDAITPIENLICRAKGSLQAIKSMVSYLEAVKRVYPSVEGVEDAIKKGKEALLSYPDNKALMAIIKKNKN